MQYILKKRRFISKRSLIWFISSLALILSVSFFPDAARDHLTYVITSLISVAPLVIPGILISAWVNASGAGSYIARAFQGNIYTTILIASFIGALTPVCGVSVLPLMTGLLAAGIPFAPIMAFWLSSPVTDPAMLTTTIATLGLHFAIGKTIAAFTIGLLGGYICASLPNYDWITAPLRSNKFTANPSASSCGQSHSFKGAIWRNSESLQRFKKELLGLTKLILICLTPAFLAENMLRHGLNPDLLVQYLGADNGWAIPTAVFIGAPAYIDGYAALPLTRILIEQGMSPGAAMAFLVSGGVVSIWGAMAIFPVLKLKAFLLFLFCAVLGSLCVGWAYEYAMQLIIETT